MQIKYFYWNKLKNNAMNETPLFMPISLIFPSIWQCTPSHIIEDLNALWHPQQDHLHHRNAQKGLPCKGDLRHIISDSFPIHTGVRQGCRLSPLVFNLCIDWRIKTTTSPAKREISWTFQQSLEDSDFADDIDLLAVQPHKNIQSKPDDLVKYSRLDLI